MNSTEVNNSQDVIDSRDVIARIDELESTLQDAADDQLHEANPEMQDDSADIDSFVSEQIASDGEFSEDAKEYQILKKLQEEAEGYAPDWQYGSQLIRESYFTEYARDLCEEIGEVPKDFPWYIAIDWDKTAENMKVDYTEVDFDGVTYLIR